MYRARLVLAGTCARLPLVNAAMQGAAFNSTNKTHYGGVFFLFPCKVREWAENDCRHGFDLALILKSPLQSATKLLSFPSETQEKKGWQPTPLSPDDTERLMHTHIYIFH